MRIWLVTARDNKGKFVDQRRIESTSQSQAERDGYDWICAVGGNVVTSTIKEDR